MPIGWRAAPCLRVFLRSCQLDNTLPQTFRLRTCYLVETHTVIYSFWTQNFGLLPIFVLDTFCTPPCHIGSTCTLCRPVEACGAQFGASCTAGVSPYTRCGELGPGSRILEILSGHGLAGGRCTGARWALRRVRGGCVGTHLDHDHDTLSTGDARTHTHRLDQIRTTACRPIAKPAQTDHKCDRSRLEACHYQL